MRRVTLLETPSAGEATSVTLERPDRSPGKPQQARGRYAAVTFECPVSIGTRTAHERPASELGRGSTRGRFCNASRTESHCVASLEIQQTASSRILGRSSRAMGWDDVAVLLGGVIRAGSTEAGIGLGSELGFRELARSGAGHLP